MSNPLNRSALSDNTSANADQAGLADISLADRIGSALGQRDWAWLSRESGISTSALSDLKTKGKMPRADNALKIAQALDVDLEWLLSGVKSRVYAKADDVRDALRSTAAAGDRPSGMATSDRRLAYRGSEDREDIVEVPQIDPRFGLGNVIMDEEAVPEMRSFSRAWLRQITHCPPEQLYWAPTRGDSMAPTIGDGEVVLIDRSAQSPRDADLIWAFAWGDLGAIKRLRPLPSGIVEIHSDNQNVPVGRAAANEIHIFGRVIAVVKKL